MKDRTYRLEVRGFDFKHVLVRAKSRGRARYLCAEAFVDAGLGAWREGFRCIVSTKLDPTADDLPILVTLREPKRHDGLCRSRLRVISTGENTSPAKET